MTKRKKASLIHFCFIKKGTKAPRRAIKEANLKFDQIGIIKERAPETAAPRAPPTLNIVDR